MTLIVTLILIPDGVAGSTYRKKKLKKKAGDPDAARTRLTARFLRKQPEARRRRASHERSRRAPRGVSVSFGGVHALVDVDLEVEEAQLVGLIGPNGAGKTTFIDAITGFVPCRGRVELDGRDLCGLPPHARARLGLARTWQCDRAVRRPHRSREPRRSPPTARRCGRRCARRSRGRSLHTQAVDDALGLLGLEQRRAS